MQLSNCGNMTEAAGRPPATPPPPPYDISGHDSSAANDFNFNVDCQLPAVKADLSPVVVAIPPTIHQDKESILRNSISAEIFGNFLIQQIKPQLKIRDKSLFNSNGRYKGSNKLSNRTIEIYL
jgi:hypothetical protein